MYEYDREQIDNLTRTNNQHRKTLMNWLVKNEEPIYVEAFRLMWENLKKSPLDQMKTEHFYSAFVSALGSMHRAESTRLKRKGGREEAEQLRDIRIKRLKANRKPRTRTKENFIRMMKSEIDRMRQEGLSWREIERYFEKYTRSRTKRGHRRISFGYIRQTYQKICAEAPEGEANS